MLSFLIVLSIIFFNSCGSGDAGHQVGARQDEIARGRDLFTRSGCAVCHGHEGRGDGRVARSLSPRPRDFRELSAYQQGNSKADIATTIKNGVGVRTSAMPAYPHLSTADAGALGAFVVFLQKQP